MQIVTVGYGPRILRYRSKDFETSEQFSATFDLSRIDVLWRGKRLGGHIKIYPMAGRSWYGFAINVLRGTCSGHLAQGCRWPLHDLARSKKGDTKQVYEPNCSPSR